VRKLHTHIVFKILILSFAIISCKKKDGFEDIKILGHAGNGLEISNSVYHDNSRNSINLAISHNGCDGVEIDVQLSKDGTAWLFHDTNLKKEANLDACINSTSDVELAKLSYNHFNDEPLLRLNDLQVEGKTLFLDLRHFNSCTEEIVDLQLFISELSLFREKNLTCVIYLCTNFIDWIIPLQNEGFKVCFAPNSKAEWQEEMAEALLFKNAEITKSEVLSFQNAGKEVFIFELRSPKGIRSALEKHPNCIISDDIKAAIIEKY
jgi:hypothetical protein